MIPGHSRSQPVESYRPVTPEVAGSSPVAPLFKHRLPAPKARVPCSGEAREEFERDARVLRRMSYVRDVTCSDDRPMLRSRYHASKPCDHGCELWPRVVAV